MTFDENMTLADAKALLRTLIHDGHECPLCTQYAKVYARQINNAMARALIGLYKAGGADSYQHWPTVDGGRGGDKAKLVHWGLVSEENAQRADGGRSGYWRITKRGVAFLRGELAVPKYADIYDGRLMGLHGDSITIRDALGKKFDLRALLGDAAAPHLTVVEGLEAVEPEDLGMYAEDAA